MDDKTMNNEPMTNDQRFGLAYEFVTRIAGWFEMGGFVRDSLGQVIFDIPELLLAIDDGRWPVEASSAA